MPVQLIRRVRTRQPQTPVGFVPNVISAGLATTMFQVDLITGRINTELGGTKGASSAGMVSSQPRARIKLNRGCSTGYTLVAVIDTGAVTNDNYVGMDDSSGNRYFQFRSGASGGASLQFIGFDTGATSYSCTAPAASSSGIHVVVGTLANGKIQAWSGNIGGNAGTDGPVSISSPKLPAAGFDMWLGSKNSTSNFFTGKCAAYALLDRGISESQARDFIANPWQIFGNEIIPIFWSGVTAQYARPTSDVSAGGWTASTGSDLFAMLDEVTANDGDYITTTSASTCEVALGSLTDPASSTGHIVRYRISATDGGIIVRLREGSTTIASWTHSPAPGSLTTYAQTLSGGEADSITNYAALKLQFEAIA